MVNPEQEVSSEHHFLETLLTKFINNQQRIRTRTKRFADCNKLKYCTCRHLLMKRCCSLSYITTSFGDSRSAVRTFSDLLLLRSKQNNLLARIKPGHESTEMLHVVSHPGEASEVDPSTNGPLHAAQELAFTIDRSFWTWLTTGASNGFMRIIIVYWRWNQYNRAFQSAWRCITRGRCQEAIRCARLLSKDSHVCWYLKWKLSKNPDMLLTVSKQGLNRQRSGYWKTPPLSHGHPKYDEAESLQSWNTDVETENTASKNNTHTLLS